jgi:hypothetical protein
VNAVADWELTEATSISADGRIVVGNGIDPAGNTEGWIARLPAVLDASSPRSAFAIHSVLASASGFQVVLTLASDAAAKIGLFDVTGRRLAEQTLPPSAGRQRIELAAAGLSSGVYWVRLEQAGRTRVAKTTRLE